MAAPASIAPPPAHSPAPAKAIRKRVQRSVDRTSQVVRGLEEALEKAQRAVDRTEVYHLRASLAHKGAELRAQKRVIRELEDQLVEITEDRLIDAKAVEEFELENRKLQAALEAPARLALSPGEHARAVHEAVRLLAARDRSFEGPWELASSEWRTVLTALAEAMEPRRRR